MTDLVLSKSQKQMMEASGNFSDLVNELIDVKTAIDNDGMLHLRAHKMRLKNEINRLTKLFHSDSSTWFETIGEGRRVRKISDADERRARDIQHTNRSKASRRAAMKRIEKGPRVLAV